MRQEPIEQKPEQPSITQPKVPRGAQAIVGAVTAIAGLLVAVRPQSPVAQAISRAAPQLGVAIPTLVGIFGTLLAAFSHPPKLHRQ